MIDSNKAVYGAVLVIILVILYFMFRPNLDKIQPKFLVIAHRGFSGKETENSLASFQKAIDLGVAVIELDVWQCRSGELVVFHDRGLRRLLNQPGKITDYNLAQLQQMRLPDGQKIPTLKEALELINRKCIVDIDLKGMDTAIPTAALLRNFLERGWEPTDFILTSFNHIELEKFHVLLPSVPFGPIISSLMTDYAKFAQKLAANYLVNDFEYTTPELVQDAHERGLKVLVYTVDGIEDIADVRAMRVDGIITNWPNLV